MKSYIFSYRMMSGRLMIEVDMFNKISSVRLT